MVLLQVRYAKYGKALDAYTGAAVCGMAFTNQHTFAFFVFVLVPCVPITHARTHR